MNRNFFSQNWVIDCIQKIEIISKMYKPCLFTLSRTGATTRRKLYIYYDYYLRTSYITKTTKLTSPSPQNLDTLFFKCSLFKQK